MKKPSLFLTPAKRLPPATPHLLLQALAACGTLIAVATACGTGPDPMDADGGASGANGSGGSDGDGGSEGDGGTDGGGGSGGSENGACVEGTFDHDDDPSTTCQSWSTCQPGLYVSSEGTATTDRECEACAAGTFSAVQNADACEAWVDCEAGEYVSIEGDEESDRECEACEAGTFSDEENAAECDAWLDCEPGEFVEVEPAEDSDRTCTPCAAGHFADEMNASACTLWTDCGHPWMLDVAGTDVSNTTCGDGIRQFDNVTGEHFSVAADAGGNAYVAGETTGALDGTNAGGVDAFVRKYDATGTVDWTRQIGTDTSEAHPVVAVDANGNIVVAGETVGELEGTNASGDWDAFIRSYNTGGTPLSTRQFGANVFRDFVREVSFDASGNTVVAGFRQDVIGVDTANTAFKCIVDSGSETRTDGVPLLTNGSWAATADVDGNFYFAGYTSGTDLDGVGAGGGDAFVNKVDSSGALVWTRQFGTSGSDLVYAIGTDADGNVFVAGSTAGDIDDDSATEGAVYVRMYDALGDPVWTRQFGTPEGERVYGLYVDDDGNVLVAGTTYGGALEGESAGGDDAFVRMYDQAGDVIWTQQFGTSGHEAAQSVTVNAAGHIFVAGKLGQGFALTGGFVAGVVPP